MPRLKERCKDLVASAMKDGIYEASLEVLREHGMEGLTMDRVADVAGVAKGSLYNYFQGKQDLIRFILERTLEPAKRAERDILAEPTTAIQRLEECLRVWFELLARNRGLFEFLINDPSTRHLHHPRERGNREEGIAVLRTIFEQGINEGAFRPFDAGRAAEMFFGAVMASVDQQLLLREDRPVDESVGNLIDVFLYGVSAEDLRKSRQAEQ
jgi:AcrR family transcriptional regulator